MRKIYRKFLTYASLGLFLVVAPILILYAIGYHYDFSRAEAQPVGVILLDSKPRRADIRVNGRQYQRTPDAVPGLPVGEYDIEVSFTGYRDWQKRVAVQAGRATELRDIILFPSQIPTSRLEEGITAYSLSPDRKLLAVSLEDESLKVIDTLGAAVLPPVQMPTPVKSMLWSPGSDSLVLLDSAGERWLFDLSQPQPRRLPLPDSVEELVWDMHVPGRLLYLTEGKLTAYQVRTKAESVIVENVRHFAPTDRLIYVIHTDGKLFAYTTQAQKTSQPLPVPEKEIKEIMATPDGELVYCMSDNSLLLVEDEDLLQISSSAVNAGWSPDGRMILLQEDRHSLHVYNASVENSPIPLNGKQLITRLSHEIVNPQWFAGSRHLIYQVQDELHVIEIDTRDHPVDETIASTNLGFSDAAVGKDGKEVFYLGKYNNAVYLMSASLVTPEDGAVPSPG